MTLFIRQNPREAPHPSRERVRHGEAKVEERRTKRELEIADEKTETLLLLCLNIILCILLQQPKGKKRKPYI